MQAAGVCPAQFSQCRMVVLPKPNKISNGATRTGDTRPISVLSCWYRTWMTAWLHTNGFKAWLRLHLPPEISFGPGSEAQLAAGVILDSVAKQGLGASLDFSKCYDTMVPQGTIALMQQAGFPTGLCNLCSAVWTSQTRFVEWQGSVHPEALQANRATACPGLVDELWF